MAKLIYITPTSLDGYLGSDGDFAWSTPDDDFFAFLNDLLRPLGTYLYGRKLYQTMAVWETPDVIPGLTPVKLEFGRVWRTAEKIVYSKSLRTVSTPKTRLERQFDVQAIRALKTQLGHDAMIGGGNLAAHAIGAGLVDEIHLFVVPFLLGRGVRILPGDARLNLDLLGEHRFASGWVYLRYRMHP